MDFLTFLCWVEMLLLKINFLFFPKNSKFQEVNIIKENMIGQEGLSPDAANRLVDLTKSRVYLTGDRNPMFVNSYRIDKSQLNKLYQYEFYVVARCKLNALPCSFMNSNLFKGQNDLKS